METFVNKLSLGVCLAVALGGLLFVAGLATDPLFYPFLIVVGLLGFVLG